MSSSFPKIGSDPSFSMCLFKATRIIVDNKVTVFVHVDASRLPLFMADVKIEIMRSDSGEFIHTCLLHD